MLAKMIGTSLCPNTHITLRLTSQFHASEEEPLGESREPRQLHRKHPGEENKSAERMQPVLVRIPHAQPVKRRQHEENSVYKRTNADGGAQK